MRDGGPSVVVVAVGFFDESVARRDKGDAHVAADPAQPVNVRVLEVVLGAQQWKTGDNARRCCIVGCRKLIFLRGEKMVGFWPAVWAQV